LLKIITSEYTKILVFPTAKNPERWSQGIMQARWL